MKLKVCGITQMDQLLSLQDMAVDYVGLIFYPASKRFVANALNEGDVKSVPVKKVGVFVNENVDIIIKTINDYGLGAVQLHGNESPELCAVLQSQAVVIKALPVKADSNLNELAKPYINVVDFFLFDTATKEGSGGTGQRWDWSLLDSYHLQKPFFLSGGIKPNDATELKNITHPMLYALDINSGFETAPGVKDVAAVRNFITDLK